MVRRVVILAIALGLGYVNYAYACRSTTILTGGKMVICTDCGTGTITCF